MSTARALLGHVAGLIGVALLSLLLTLGFMLLLGSICAGASFYLLYDVPPVPAKAVIAALLALVEAVVLGTMAASKRALAASLTHGFRKLRLGRAAVQLIWSRLLGNTKEQEPEERGRIARTIERIPLAQAEAKLGQTVRDLIRGEEGNWLQRKLQTRLLRSVEKYTLGRFREEGDAGVDLGKVQTDLEDRVDDMLIRKVRGGVNLTTALFALGFLVLVALQTFALYAFTAMT